MARNEEQAGRNGQGNRPSGAAKTAKNDEFHTQYGNISKEVNASLEFDPDPFRGKSVLLPCDDPEWSKFTRAAGGRGVAIDLRKDSHQGEGVGELGSQGPRKLEDQRKGTANMGEILKRETRWEHLYYYRKSDVLFQMTVSFCGRFFPKFGDRTVDQMVQAARSGKQNIVEGLADGVTSTEMELKLLNVARASLRELREDYADYLKTNKLAAWTAGHPRYDALLAFCRVHNDLPDYEPYFQRWSDEEFANCALSLCHMVDKMMTTALEKKERDFVENGGIRERMTAARLGRRQSQNEEIAALRARVAELEAENAALRARPENPEKETKG